jgi:hypothetical protein
MTLTPKALRELFHTDVPSHGDPTSGDRNRRIALYYGHRSNRPGYHASGCYHGTLTDDYVGKNYGSWTDECIPLDLHSLGFSEVSDYSNPHAERNIFFDGY